MGYDVCYRAGMAHFKPVSEIIPDTNTIANIITMIKRTLSFWEQYGPIIKDGFTFEGGYTSIISAGDGDYLTKDTLWDLKVLKEDLIKRVVSMEFNRFLEYYSNAPEIEIPSTNDRRSERGLRDQPVGPAEGGDRGPGRCPSASQWRRGSGCIPGEEKGQLPVSCSRFPVGENRGSMQYSYEMNILLSNLGSTVSPCCPVLFISYDSAGSFLKKGLASFVNIVYNAKRCWKLTLL